MPGNITPLVIPTGYEVQEQDIANRRRLAQMMLEKGLSPDAHMTSWAQPLAEMAAAFAGKRMEKKADDKQNALGTQIRSDYSNQLRGFFKDVNSGMSQQGLVEKYSGSPLLQDALKAHNEAYAASLKEGGEHTTFNGQYRTKGSIPEGATDYTGSLIPGADNQMHVNPLKTTYNLSSQYPPNDVSSPGHMTYAIPANGLAPQPGGQGVPQPVPAQGQGQGAGIPQPGVPSSDGGGGNSIDVSLLNPQEKQILTTELQRRAGNVGPTGGGSPVLQNDTHTPFGNPLTVQKPPSGVVNGKPYWIVNGTPFDNPEGN